MNKKHLRAIAICPFLHAGKILVFRGWDTVKQSAFYRPLGGAIEFGEPAWRTIVREMAEELHAQVSQPRYLFTLENIFTFNGQPGHEIVLVFEAELLDDNLYQRSDLQAYEDNGQAFTAVWKALDDFAPGRDTLYPDGLYQRLIDTKPKNF